MHNEPISTHDTAAVVNMANLVPFLRPLTRTPIVLKHVPLDILSTHLLLDKACYLVKSSAAWPGPSHPAAISFPAALPPLHCSGLAPASGPLCSLSLTCSNRARIFPELALSHHSESVIIPQASSDHLSFSIPTPSTIWKSFVSCLSPPPTRQLLHAREPWLSCSPCSPRLHTPPEWLTLSRW